MFEAFTTVARQVGTLFSLMAVGFVCCRLGVFGERAVKGMVELLVIVVAPALIITAFQRPFDPALGSSLAFAIVAALAVHAIGWLASRALRGGRMNDSRLRTLRMGVVFSNAGFMGIPLEKALLGDAGVFYGAAYVAVFNVLIWTYGVAHMSGRVKDVRIKSALVNPGMIGIAIALALFVFSVRLPEALGAPVEMLAGLNTPLAMLVIGFYLAKARFAAVAGCGGAWAAAALRLVAVPLVAIAFLLAARHLGLKLDGDMAVAITVAASAPVAALVTAFSVRYRRDTELSVGVVAGTTLLSVLTMPPVVALAMTLFK